MEAFDDIWENTMSPTIGANSDSEITNGLDEATAMKYVVASGLSDEELLKKIEKREL